MTINSRVTVTLSHSLPAGRVCFLDSLGLEAKQASLKLVNVLIFFSPAHTLVKSPLTGLSPCVRACSVLSVKSNTCQPHRLEPTRLFCPWDFPGKNTGVDCHFLLQIILIQGSNPHLLWLLHWQRIPYH